MYIQVQAKGWDEGFKKLTQEDWEELRLLAPGIPVTKEEIQYKWFMADMPVLSWLADHNIGIEMKPAPGAHNTMLTKMKGDGEFGSLLEHALGGSMAQIHVPDNELMKIQHVKVVTNCCTEELQQMLDEGWRILAVCPPNAQRRPDYVLGLRGENSGLRRADLHGIMAQMDAMADTIRSLGRLQVQALEAGGVVGKVPPIVFPSQGMAPPPPPAPSSDDDSEEVPF